MQPLLPVDWNKHVPAGNRFRITLVRPGIIYGFSYAKTAAGVRRVLDRLQVKSWTKSTRPLRFHVDHAPPPPATRVNPIRPFAQWEPVYEGIFSETTDVS